MHINANCYYRALGQRLWNKYRPTKDYSILLFKQFTSCWASLNSIFWCPLILQPLFTYFVILHFPDPARSFIYRACIFSAPAPEYCGFFSFESLTTTYHWLPAWQRVIWKCIHNVAPACDIYRTSASLPLEVVRGPLYTAAVCVSGSIGLSVRTVARLIVWDFFPSTLLISLLSFPFLFLFPSLP